MRAGLTHLHYLARVERLISIRLLLLITFHAIVQYCGALLN